MKNKYDVIIVGSGIGGLISGCYLAQEGIKTLVIEKHSIPGGYCISFQRKGYSFDVGVHYLGAINRGVLGHILDELEIRDSLRLKKVNPSYKIIMPDYSIHIGEDPSLFIKKLCEYFPKEKLNIVKFFRLVLCKDFFFAYPRIRKLTFKDVIDSYFENRKLTAIINVMLGNIGLPANEISALTGMILLRQYVFDAAYYPNGNIQSFPDSLVKLFKNLGGEIIFSRKVKEIITKNGEAKGVEFENGDRVMSKNVISNVDATYTFKELLAIGTPESRVVDKLEISPAMFAVYLGLKGKVVNAASENMCIARAFTYDENKYFSVTQETIRKKNPSVLIFSFPSSYSERLLSTNRYTIQLLTFAPYASRDFWSRNRMPFADKMIRLAEKTIGLFSKNVEIKETATPHTFYHYTNNRDGSAYGWAATAEQAKITVFPQKTSVRGLYLAGHWTTSSVVQGGVPGVALSGRKVAELILKDCGKRWRHGLIRLSAGVESLK